MPSVWTDAQIDAALDDMKSIGVQWIRTGISWLKVQPNSANDWDFSIADKIISKIRAPGMDILFQITTPLPGWARPPGVEDYEGLPTTQTAAFQKFTSAMAQRYAPQGVHSWEIFNEYNSRYTATEYGPVLKAAHDGIHAADPDATVMNGGLIPRDSTSLEGPVAFLQSLYAHGYSDTFDAVALHPYTWGLPLTFPGSNWSEMAESSQSVRSVMVANGDAAKKIWITEFGFATWSATDPARLTEENQVLWLQEAYSRAQSYDWAGPLFWFSYRDDGIQTTTSENFFGLVKYDLSPKPAYYEYANIPNAQR
jgi:polysaccharide biosynthesis protein PslG